MRVAPPVDVSEEEKRQLLSWSRGRSTQQRFVLRSKIVLLATDGLQNKDIAEKLHARPKTVTLWRSRFAVHRLAGIIKDAPRPGRKPRISQQKIDQVIDLTLRSKPRGSTHWSTRALAKETGLSNFTIYEIWKAHR